MVQLGPRLGTKKVVGLTSDKFVRFRWFQSGTKGSPRGDGPNSVDAEGAETNRKIVRVRIVQSLLRRAEKTGWSLRTLRVRSWIASGSTELGAHLTLGVKFH